MPSHNQKQYCYKTHYNRYPRHYCLHITLILSACSMRRTRILLQSHPHCQTVRRRLPANWMPCVQNDGCPACAAGHPCFGSRLFVQKFSGGADVFQKIHLPFGVFDALNAPTETGKEIRAAGFIHNVLEDLAQPIEFFIAAIGVDEFDGGFQIVRYRGNLFFPPRVGIIVSGGLTAAIEDRGMQILKFLY